MRTCAKRMFGKIATGTNGRGRKLKLSQEYTKKNTLKLVKDTIKETK